MVGLSTGCAIAVDHPFNFCIILIVNKLIKSPTKIFPLEGSTIIHSCCYAVMNNGFYIMFVLLAIASMMAEPVTYSQFIRANKDC